MAHIQVRLIAVAVFGVGMVVGLLVLSLSAYSSFGVGTAMRAPDWEFALQVSALAAVAASLGFATARCKSVVRSLCAVPIALLLTSFVPDRFGYWLSESFQSVTVNVIAACLLFAVGGALAGWLSSKLFNREPRHA